MTDPGGKCRKIRDALWQLDCGAAGACHRPGIFVDLIVARAGTSGQSGRSRRRSSAFLCRHRQEDHAGGGQHFDGLATFAARRSNDPLEEFFSRFFGESPPRENNLRSLGSGILISNDGEILTNYHVVRNADTIKVKLADQSEHEARLIGKDDRTDLALIKIRKSGGNLPFAKLGASAQLEVGDWVMAIGNPFGLEHTVTAGIVSAKGRVIGAGPYDNFIQTDASINPGNSGGPLINAAGEVIGVNSAIFSQSGGNVGIGFAIPIDLAKKVAEQLRKNGRVVRGWLGVRAQDVTPGDGAVARFNPQSSRDGGRDGGHRRQPGRGERRQDRRYHC